MKYLTVNLKILFASIWNIIMIIAALSIYGFVFFQNGGNVGQFTYESFAFNLFLTVFVSMVSVFISHNTDEFESSLVSCKKIIVVKLITVVIFSSSSLLFAIPTLIVGGIISSVSASVLVNCFTYIIASAIPQIIFISVISLGISYCIKNKSAYFVCVLTSLLFTPIIQNTIFRQASSLLEDKTYAAFFNLINIAYDETYRIKYSGFGMPFNYETIISWIITLLVGVIIFLFILIFKKSLLLKGTIVSCVLLVCGFISVGACINGYFDNSPISYNYAWSDTDGDGIEESPKKVDICDTYYDEKSPIITKYEMNIRTGNVIDNQCTLTLNMNENTYLRLKLDECFKINELLVNGKETEYFRNSDYFEINDIASHGEIVIQIKYSGRMNYTDALHNKCDFFDYCGGYLSQIFAWYPKLLSQQNLQQEKEYIVTIASVNSFVTNLDDNLLHSSGNYTFSGKETELYFYMGYISETEIDGKRVILPTEYVNNVHSLSLLSNIMNEKPYTLEGLFAAFDLDTDGLNDDERHQLLNEWLNMQFADNSQMQNVKSILVMPTSYNGAGVIYINDNVLFVSEFSIITRCW